MAIILYFAALRDLAGTGSEELPLPAEILTVAALSALLEARHPALAGRLGAVRFAVNETFANGDEPVDDGDVVALIPPVAGGAPRVAVRSTELSTDEVMAMVRHPGAGAVAVFVGTVRDASEGREVARLEYEAYESMAVGEMERILAGIEREIPCVRLAAHHRVGSLGIGDVAVVCAASSPHRAEAFRACRAAIDRIKETVPIWKREHDAGGARWVGWQEGPTQKE